MVIAHRVGLILLIKYCMQSCGMNKESTITLYREKGPGRRWEVRRLRAQSREGMSYG